MQKNALNFDFIIFMVDITSQLSYETLISYFKLNPNTNKPFFDPSYFIEKRSCVVINRAQDPSKFAFSPSLLQENLATIFKLDLFYGNLIVKTRIFFLEIRF